MKITIAQGAFLPVPPRLGGAVEKAWYALGREFARQGHEVTHVGRTFPGLPDNETDQGVTYRRVRGYATPAQLWRLKLLDLLYSRRASRALPQADILVTNTFWLPVVERRPSRGRIVVHVARFPRGQLRFYPRNATLQTVSSAIQSAILEDVPSAATRTRVVPYPIAPSYLESHDKITERVILYTGRVHPEKGLPLLLEAFAASVREGLKGWTLRIVGPWETAQGGGGERYASELRQQAATTPGAVDWVGPVFDEAALIDHYRRAAIFAYPSLADKGETFGLSILEAMAAGCPAVVSNLACFRDIVQERTNGMIFDHHAPDRVEQLAAKLLLLAREPERRESLGQNARATALRFALPDIARQFVSLFSEISGNNS